MENKSKEEIIKLAHKLSLKEYPIEICGEHGYPVRIGQDFNEYDREIYKKGIICGINQQNAALKKENEELKSDIAIMEVEYKNLLIEKINLKYKAEEMYELLTKCNQLLSDLELIHGAKIKVYGLQGAIENYKK